MKNHLRKIYEERRNDVINTLSSNINDDDCPDSRRKKISQAINNILLSPTGLLPDVEGETIGVFLEIYDELTSIFAQKESSKVWISLSDVLADIF